MATGKVKTLYFDKEKTEALFPRTKTSAISDANGVGLDALLENILYSGTDNPEAAVVPLDADTLGGIPADDYATENFVAAKIAEAQLDGGDVDLSGYVTKDELNALDAEDVGARPNTWTPTASEVGARPNTWTPSASDVGAAPATHSHTKSQISDFPTSMPASDVYAWAKAASKPSYSYSEVGAAPSSHNHSASNITSGTLSVARGGTGATSAANARTSLGLAMFAAYNLSSSSWVGVFKDNWNSIADGTFIIYGRTGSAFCAVGIKAGNYGAALAFNYVDPELYLYRNNNGTWSEAAVIK